MRYINLRFTYLLTCVKWALPVENWRILLLQSFTACMPLITATVREKMLQFSSTVLPTLSPYIMQTEPHIQLLTHAFTLPQIHQAAGSSADSRGRLAGS